MGGTVTNGDRPRRTSAGPCSAVRESRPAPGGTHLGVGGLHKVLHDEPTGRRRRAGRPAGRTRRREHRSPSRPSAEPLRELGGARRGGAPGGPALTLRLPCSLTLRAGVVWREGRFFTSPSVLRQPQRRGCVVSGGRPRAVARAIARGGRGAVAERPRRLARAPRKPPLPGVRAYQRRRVWLLPPRVLLLLPRAGERAGVGTPAPPSRPRGWDTPEGGGTDAGALPPPPPPRCTSGGRLSVRSA